MPNKQENTLARIKRTLSKIEDGKMYDSKEIAKMRLAINTKGVASNFTLYRLIRSGKLAAINLSTGDAPRYAVEGKVLKRFFSERYNLSK